MNLCKNGSAMTLTKSQINHTIQTQTRFTGEQSAEITETLLEIIKRTLESREDVLISGFGKFCVKERRERRGRNPATGEKIMLPSKRRVMFRWSWKLREKVNGG